MNCLSHRALLGAVVSAGAAVFLVLTASGVYAGMTTFAPQAAESAEAATTEDEEPAIVFSGSAMAPLVCTSTPDTEAVTITDGMRITLANLTGADANVDTGTDQALTVAAGIGVSVRFRPGQYAVRMIPDCTMTNAVDAAVLTVTEEPEVTPQPSLDPSPSAPVVTPPAPTGPISPSGGSSRTAGAVIPRPSLSSVITTTPPPPSSAANPATTVAPGASVIPPADRSDDPSPVPVAAGPEPVIYDVHMVPVRQPGDPRDDRLLAVIAVICVFGVTTAIIRAIVSQRARGMVST